MSEIYIKFLSYLYSDKEIANLSPGKKRQLISVVDDLFFVIEPIKKVVNRFSGKSFLGNCKFPFSKGGKLINVSLGLFEKGAGFKAINQAKKVFKKLKKLSKSIGIDPRKHLNKNSEENSKKQIKKDSLSNDLKENHIYCSERSKSSKKTKFKNFKYWGHNCFSIETKSTALLIDPWFSKKGAFYGSWFQYPKNHIFQEDVLALLSKKNKSFIFISHEHEDHFDEDFLKLISKNTSIIIPDYEDKDFKNKISNYSSNIIEAKDDKELLLSSEIKILLKISDFGVNHDSAIFVKTNNFSFFNQNDCKIFDRLRDLENKVDFYSVQFSGANAHPSTFLFSEKKKNKISKEKVDNKLNNVLRALETIKPKYFLPAAGPAIFPFLDLDLSLSKENIFIHQEILQEFLSRNGFHSTIYLKPGDSFTSKKSFPIPHPNEDDIRQYKLNLKNPWEELPEILNRKLLENNIKNRLHKIKDINLSKCPILIFNYSETFDENDKSNKEKIYIDLNKKQLISKFDYKSSYMEIISSSRYFNLMCSERWQNVSLTFRAKIKVKPDLFNNDVNIFLFSDLSNIRSNFLKTKKVKNERIIVKNKRNDCFMINKFCPHQKANLTYAQINDKNELICPAHGWRFNLEKDGVDEKSTLSIKSIALKKEEN